MNNELKEKMIISLNNKLLEDVISYCKVNDIEDDDIPIWFYKLVEDAFMVKKYGTSPFSTENNVISVEPSKHDEPVAVEEDTTKSIETTITEEVTLVENKKKRRTLKTK